jgi:hypothetical protein
VDIGLAELTAVRVERKPAAEFDRAVGDEVARLTSAAEAQFFQLHEHIRGEVVVQDRGADVLRADAGLAPELARDHAHLRQRAHVVAVIAGHRELVGTRALRGGLDHRRAVRQVTGPFLAGDHDRHRPVAFLTAVEQVQRLDDPAGLLVLGQRDRLAVEPGVRVRRGVLPVRDRHPAEVLAGRARLVHVPAGRHGHRRGRRGQAHRVIPANVDT